MTHQVVEMQFARSADVLESRALPNQADIQQVVLSEYLVVSRGASKDVGTEELFHLGEHVWEWHNGFSSNDHAANVPQR